MTRLVDLPDGLHEGIEESRYHEKVLGLASKGALEQMAQSPLHYRTWIDTPEGEPSEALAFGRLFHCALLEPERFASTYVIAPAFGDLRKTERTSKEDAKENKTRRAAWLLENAGKNPIDAETHATLLGMAAAVRAHSRAGPALRDGVSEATALWTDKETGVRCKVRADRYSAKRGMLLDVKSTRKASREGFVKDAANYRYHWQAALYRMGFAAVGAEAKHFVFVACEKEPPYAVGVYTLNDDAIARGYGAVRTNIERMAECLRSNSWPGYPEQIQEIELPPWAA